jgi:hypothetical protein
LRNSKRFSERNESTVVLSATAANVIGIFGSVLFIAAFAYANVSPAMNKVIFNLANLVGAICLLISLWVHFNLAAFVLEVAWAMIALVGLVTALRARA